jgi:hypothetical protein
VARDSNCPLASSANGLCASRDVTDLVSGYGASVRRKWGEDPMARQSFKDNTPDQDAACVIRLRKRISNDPGNFLGRERDEGPFALTLDYPLGRFSVSFEDWIFSLHLLTAATLVGSLVMSWIVVIALRSTDTPDATLSLNRVGHVGTAAIVVGLVGAISFGIWLAILRDNFHVWDGWVIAAIVLWIIATAALLRSFVEYAKPAEKARALVASGQTASNADLTALNRTSTGLLLRVLSSTAIVLIVIDMIWKPGA